MYLFKKITPTNGFDSENLGNARQNNYAWSMAELGEYIYVGTGRNIPLIALQSLVPGINTPALITPVVQDNLAEIWRYKKDGSLPWERVFKAPVGSGVAGFRYMLSYRPSGGSPCLIAATFGKQILIYKSTNGVDWFLSEASLDLTGTSSRAMVAINNVLYVAAFLEGADNQPPLLYSTKDPEFYPWVNVIDTTDPNYDESKNPNGAISNMVVFKNRLYLGISSEDGCQVWRSNGEVPKLNDWTLIVDKGFGDSANKYTLSMGVYKDFVYVSGTKPLPLAWVLPIGCDIIRIDEEDNWELVVGGRPFVPAVPSKGSRTKSISGYKSGFNNPFNVYAWQIQEYNGRLLISTFDDSSNMEVILNTILANRGAIEKQIGEEATAIIVGVYEALLKILVLVKYQFGFDLYESKNGVCFRPEFKNGLGNPGNYGGRILFLDSYNKLFLGTANPFQGCEVWRVKEDSCNSDKRPYYGPHLSKLDKELYYKYQFETVLEEVRKHFDVLSENLPLIMDYLPKSVYHNYI